jgi:hypothetical protein
MKHTVRVDLVRWNTSTEFRVGIHRWLTEHCLNRYTRFGNVFNFEQEQDAVFFALRWQ